MRTRYPIRVKTNRVPQREILLIGRWLPVRALIQACGFSISARQRASGVRVLRVDLVGEVNWVINDLEGGLGVCHTGSDGEKIDLIVCQLES